MLLFAAEILATTALALLISRAEITEMFRAAAPRLIQHGLRCSFCTSFWCAAALVAIVGPPVGVPLLLAVLAVWGGAAAAIGLALTSLPEQG